MDFFFLACIKKCVVQRSADQQGETVILIYSLQTSCFAPHTFFYFLLDTLATGLDSESFTVLAIHCFLLDKLLRTSPGSSLQQDPKPCRGTENVNRFFSAELDSNWASCFLICNKTLVKGEASFVTKPRQPITLIQRDRSYLYFNKGTQTLASLQNVPEKAGRLVKVESCQGPFPQHFLISMELLIQTVKQKSLAYAAPVPCRVDNIFMLCFQGGS